MVIRFVFGLKFQKKVQAAMFVQLIQGRLREV